MLNIRIISAGAGSGKTYRLTQEMVQLLKSGVRPSGIIATTFTNKAAAELKERVRIKLLESHLFQAAEDMSHALIGTVHGLGVKLLQRFAFEAGIAPNATIMADADQQLMFNQSLAVVLHEDRVQEVEVLCDHLGLHKRMRYDWRSIVKQIVDVARTNNFTEDQLLDSKQRSIDSFLTFLDAPKAVEPTDISQHLLEAIEALQHNEDQTKKTMSVVHTLQSMHQELKLAGHLPWHQWAKIGKLTPGKKSKEQLLPLQEFAIQHLSFPDFHEDIKAFIGKIFDLAILAIQEFSHYKKQRGLIDYTDMEALVNDLLDQPTVIEELREEIDLLMVDEFQDTSPIQLEIFLKLTKIAKQSIWVGDPKQSIYGFRGAEPALMQAVMEAVGGVKPTDIQRYSWRSREDIVFATNALFTKAFANIPEEQVALLPKRTKVATDDSLHQENEPLDFPDALQHWHFQYEGERKKSAKDWLSYAIGQALKEVLQIGLPILPKGEKETRNARPGDVAILCRSNAACQQTAEALTSLGFKVAVAQTGLLETKEARLVLACLRYLLNSYDALSLAEILILAENYTTQDIISKRLTFIEENKHADHYARWHISAHTINQLDTLRANNDDLSCTESLQLLYSQLSIRHIVATWGQASQRWENLEAISKWAEEYEANCTRLHQSASLGGFLIWLKDLGNQEKDKQGLVIDQDTVQVLTYHRSKGLEWPVVICNSLETPLKKQIFGLKIKQQKGTIDLNQVLANRWLQYWVNPYADQIKNTLLEQRIQEATYYKDLEKEALLEDARLFYVGITRARDYLVFPTRDHHTNWLNRVWHEGDENAPTLDPDTDESPWAWDGHQLSKQTHTFNYNDDFETQNAAESRPMFWPRSEGPKPYESYVIDANEPNAPAPYRCQVEGPQCYLDNLVYPPEAEPYLLAKSIKRFLLADFIDYPPTNRQAIAAACLKSQDLQDQVDVQNLLQQSKHFYQFVARQFNPMNSYRKYPVQLQKQGRIFQNVIDLLLETEQSLVIIQHSSFAGQEKDCKHKSKSLANWFALVKEACLLVHPQKKVHCYVHYVLQQCIQEVVMMPPMKGQEEQLTLFGKG